MWRWPVACLFASLSLGCAGGEPSPRAPEPGTTTVRVVNDVGDGYELGRLTLTIDGVDLPLSAIPPAGRRPGAASSVHLAPGEHTLAARATAVASGGAHFVVGSNQTFHTTDAPQLVTVRVVGRAASADPLAEPIAVDVRVGEGAPLPDACAKKPPVDRDVCRARDSLARAIQRRDVVMASCVRDQLAEMQRLADLRDGTGASDTADLIETRVATLARKADGCSSTEASDDEATPLPLGVSPRAPTSSTVR
ncbi:MAG TPA: hypothetical protein VGM56_23970 [Byssovorax sp.]